MTDVLQDGLSDIHIRRHMGNDLAVVEAARVSYSKDKGIEWKDSDAKLIRFMGRHNHGTPFEHTAITFHVSLPIFVVRQWHRHRIGVSYNEVSRRYTTEDIKFHAPTEWRLQNVEGNKQGSSGVVSDDIAYALSVKYNNLITVAEEFYRFAVKHGVANEQARMGLLQSLYTRMYFTCNLRSAAHFINLRSDPHAQPEIRAYSDAMYEQLKELFPVSIPALCDPIPEPRKLSWFERLLAWLGG